MKCTTTHDPMGGGRPRLIFSFAHQTQVLPEPREFDLVPGVTTIGSDRLSHLQLAGTDHRHAEVRRNDADEYVFFHTGIYVSSRINGQRASSATLRTGSRIQLGPWTLVYYREEFADHGRPYGGRLGGSEEGSRQRGQLEPRNRGTSPTGGCHREGDDCGEYF